MRITEHVACRDAKDDKFLELAVNGHADLIVSGDADLLVLDPWNPDHHPGGVRSRPDGVIWVLWPGLTHHAGSLNKA